MSFVQERSQRYKLLVVEDEPANLQLITSVLSDDYEFSIAKTKAKALEILSDKKIDIIILDINLPDGSGFDICRHVKSNQDIYGDISIIFLTGLDSPDDETLGLNLGASDYIHKPINAAILKARVATQTRLLRKSELLSELARIDALTEIPNRRAFDDHLTREWHRAVRFKCPLTLVLVDIDYFKQFNDTYGHPEGDICLRRIARSLTSSFQRGTDFVARYGGEEFAIILYDTDSEIAQTLVHDALQAVVTLDIPHAQSKASDCVTFSAGVCTAIPESVDAQGFVEKTDQLLYQAKANGRAQLSADRY